MPSGAPGTTARRRYVAAKVLQQRDAHSLLRFVREQAVRIDHPHVLAPASWAADDDKVLFTMGLVGGGSLVHLIGDYGPLPPAFVCTLLDQLLAGLTAVHAEGVVHRDIKPANILLEATGTGRPRLRLSDFGISMRLGEPRLTETNYVVGTPGYVAPEQLSGAEPDFPADLFAVGLVALYLLEGAKPDAKALVEHFTAHGTPGAPKGIPEPLWQVVASLLEPDPQARFRTATGARKALVAARELLPEPGPDDELIEIFDQLGPLPAGFGPEGPLTTTQASARPQEQAQPQEQLPARPQRHDSAPRPPDPNASPPSPSPFPSPSPSPSPRTGAVSPEVHTGAVSPTAHPAPELPSAERPTGVPVPAQPPARPAPYPPPPAPAPAPHEHQPQPPYQYQQPLSQPQPQPQPREGAAASTAAYTAQDIRVSAQPQPVARHRARRARRRPGPPAAVTVPVLLLALVCFAVGFWALTRL
ncbi:serine/threonine protein kinase [Streptomyces aurantiacus]|nr:serine/threonine protein kinase [Streptomyces aurantiacus]